MVAPLIPRLSEVFEIPAQEIALIVPAYMLSYALTALFYGLLSDRFGRWSVIQVSLILFIVFTALTATAQSAFQMMVWRVLTGIGASGVIPLTFALIGDLFPFNQRGAKLGLVFAPMEGDGCWVSRGALLEPFVGWQTLFIGTSVITAIVLWLLRPYRSLFDSPKVKKLPSVQQVFAGYRTVLSNVRGARTYAYVLWNGVYHSGVYTWLGFHLSQPYEMGEVGIGLTILGYGITGLLFSSLIGRAADRWGRRSLIPLVWG